MKIRDLIRPLSGLRYGLGGSAMAVAIGVFLSKSVGFGKELIVANQLGAGEALDIFLIVYLFPTFVFGVLSGAIQSSTVPEYMSCRSRHGGELAMRFAAQGGGIVLAMLVVVTFVMIPIAGELVPVVASGFSENARHQVIHLIPWMMPLLVLTCFSSYWAGMLNAEGRFALAACVPIITPLCVVLSLWTGTGGNGSMRLVAGTLIGGAVEVALVTWGAISLGFRLFGSGARRESRWSAVTWQFLAMVGSSSLMAATMFIDQAFAARLSLGSVSVLSYGTKLGGAASSMMVLVVSTLALPGMSRLAAECEWRRMHDTFVRVSILLFGATAFVALIVSVFSRQIIDTVFQHGAFSVAAAGVAANVQTFHAWHIPFYVAGTVALRTLVALRLSHVAVLGSAINLATNVLTNVLAAPKLGVAGVALASTTMYASSCLFLSAIALRELRRRKSPIASGAGA